MLHRCHRNWRCSAVVLQGHNSRILPSLVTQLLTQRYTHPHTYSHRDTHTQSVLDMNIVISWVYARLKRTCVALEMQLNQFSRACLVVLMCISSLSAHFWLGVGLHLSHTTEPIPYIHTHTHTDTQTHTKNTPTVYAQSTHLWSCCRNRDTYRMQTSYPRLFVL